MGREIPIEINGVDWRIRYTPQIRTTRKDLKGIPLDGLCVWKTKTIWLKTGQTKQQEIEAVLHEVEHAQKPDYDEPAVDRNAKEQVKILKACGLI